MSVVTIYRKFLGQPEHLSREQVQRLKRLPKDQGRKELAAILYGEGEKLTTAFVKHELKRGDSPFQGVSAAQFFHEMIAVTLWIMDKEITGGKLLLVNDLHENYFRAYTALDLTSEQRQAALRKKYQGYEDTWNEITGHLDEFGLKIVQNIFGKDENMRTRERTFWIIHYADDIVKTFTPYKKLWKEIGKGGPSAK